ncbi:MAG TPA: polyphosphate polymerase domain-containing protein [Anaerovoracaceae bacterium]|nr:polyphosphate polymerase domain-containing protein [Anaerovoracaceae bacterium]
MTTEVFNRYENKYFISEIALNRILSEIEQHMEPDKFNRGRKTYSISNIYYDTADDYLIRTSLAKPKYKEKLRLRAYGVPDKNGMAFLEMKKKCVGLVNKRRTRIPLQDGYRFVTDGEITNLSEGMNPQVSREISCMIRRYGSLEPKVMIAYDRLAFFETGNFDLRVSFDTNIRSRRENLKLEKGNYGSLFIPKGIWLMEIKTANAVPLWLTAILSREGIYKTSFSKYGCEYKNYTLNFKENYFYAKEDHYHA